MKRNNTFCYDKLRNRAMNLFSVSRHLLVNSRSFKRCEHSSRSSGTPSHHFRSLDTVHPNLSSYPSIKAMGVLAPVLLRHKTPAVAVSAMRHRTPVVYPLWRSTTFVETEKSTGTGALEMTQPCWKANQRTLWSVGLSGKSASHRKNLHPSISIKICPFLSSR